MNPQRKPIPLALALLLALFIAACAAPANDNPTPTTVAATVAPATSQPANDSPADPADAQTQSWSQPPAMTIDPSKTYLATFKTEKGDITVELYAQDAPLAVNNLIFLANEGYYDGTTFHRVLEGFMAQGGDPTGTGSGGPGYRFDNEIAPGLTFDRPGLLAMANSGPNTNGSQFFITFAPAPWLDGGYTMFGEVISGMNVLNSLTLRDPEQAPDFDGDTLITIEISEAATSQRATPTPAPTPFAPDLSADDHFMSAIPLADRVNYWNRPTADSLDPDQIYIATFSTEVGEITVELMPGLAPASVANFVALANAGYYDGTHFYQVIEDLVAIGGDPLGDGTGNPGYTLDPEQQKETFDNGGWFGGAQQGPSGVGQFFFTLSPAPWLAQTFTPMGRVIEGIEALSNLEIRDPSLAPESPGTLIQRIDISSAEISRLPTPTPTPEPFSPELPAEGARPLSEISPIRRDGYFNTAPAMQIDTELDYVAILRTEAGDITIDLFEQMAPITVNNFVVLAENGFYDGLTFFQVVEGTVAVTGDPVETGTGGPGYTFDDEFVDELRHDEAGIVSMATGFANNNGSQFLITLGAAPWLDDRLSIFGKVVDGMDVVNGIALRDPATATEPGTTVLSIDIETR